jgi:hypothetical protein
MKILKKPKLVPVRCKRCGCLFQPKMRDLQVITGVQKSKFSVKDEVICPVCKTTNRANFDSQSRTVINDDG